MMDKSVDELADHGPFAIQILRGPIRSQTA